MRPRDVSPLQFLFRIGGAVLLFLFSVLIYTQTHLGIYESADPDFLKWLRVMGIAMMFHAILLFACQFLGLAERIEGIGISIIFNAAYFILLLQLFTQPEIAPVLAYNEDQAYLLEDSDFKHLLVKAVVGAVLLFIVANILGHLKTLLYLSKGKGRR